jgi:hypothetical protein
MNRLDFRKKYGISLDNSEEGFYSVYVTRKGFDKSLGEAIHLWNPAKVLNMLRDLPIIELKRDDPKLFNKVKNLVRDLEERITYLKTHDPMYYRFQIKTILHE